MPEVLKLTPVIKENIWGGTGLAEYGYALPSDTCGEAWVVSAHPHGDCPVAGGRFDGMTLSQVWREHRELFGRDMPEEFPLLVKIIDAKDDLSIQVHPDDAYAAANENGSQGKAECWLIRRCAPDARIVFGHRARTPEELKEMVREGRFEQLILTRPVKEGDFFEIVPGTVHSLGRGVQVVEVQQNSDITYRLYDHGRLQNGRPRPLHLKQALDVIRVPFVYDPPVSRTRFEEGAQVRVLSVRPEYAAALVQVAGRWKAGWQVPFVCGAVLDGEGEAGGVPVRKGDGFVALSPEGLTVSGALTIEFAAPAGSVL